MAEPMSGGPTADTSSPPPQPDLEMVGEEIDHLLDRLSQAGPGTARAAESLVRVLMDLYGRGLERIVDAVDEETIRRLADDRLVAGLLSLHDLHPLDVRRRVEAALGQLRPRLGTGDDDLSIVDFDDGVLRLRRGAGAGGCGSSWPSIRQTVEDTVFAVAPEVVEIEVEHAAEAPGRVLIPLETLSRRPRETIDPS